MYKHVQIRRWITSEWTIFHPYSVLTYLVANGFTSLLVELYYELKAVHSLLFKTERAVIHCLNIQSALLLISKWSIEFVLLLISYKAALSSQGHEEWMCCLQVLSRFWWGSASEEHNCTGDSNLIIMAFLLESYWSFSVGMQLKETVAEMFLGVASLHHSESIVLHEFFLLCKCLFLNPWYLVWIISYITFLELFLSFLIYASRRRSSLLLSLWFNVSSCSPAYCDVKQHDSVFKG